MINTAPSGFLGETESLNRLIEAFFGKRALVLGDVMIDRFSWGDVYRISPEAPVPVVGVKQESVYAGEAGKVARNLVPFPGRVHIVGLSAPIRMAMP